MKSKVILASRSPRRKRILEYLGWDFKAVPANINEDSIEYEDDPGEYAMNIAKLKANEIAPSYPNHLVIAADTIVILNNTIYGKPENYNHAKKMIRNLSGTSHTVITGVCIIKKDSDIFSFDYSSTKVEFDRLSEDKINKYLKYGEYEDKAGAYGIQGKGAVLVKKIDGCFYNVMGLPINKLETMLNKTGRSFFI